MKQSKLNLEKMSEEDLKNEVGKFYHKNPIEEFYKGKEKELTIGKNMIYNTLSKEKI